MAAAASIHPGPLPGTKTLPWFDEAATVTGPFRELLEKYIHIPPAEVDQHVVQLVGDDSPSPFPGTWV